MENNEFNGYALHRLFFAHVYQSKENLSPVHIALYTYLVELNNQLNWKDEFNLPTYDTMEHIRLKSWRTYKKAFDDLIRMGFVELIQKSTNQHTANRITLKTAYVLKAKAEQKQRQKQSRSRAVLDKPTINQLKLLNLFSEKNLNDVFSEFLFERNSNLNNPMSEIRIKKLMNELNSLGKSESDKIKIVNQAIAGNYPSFRPLPTEKYNPDKQGLSQMNYTD